MTALFLWTLQSTKPAGNGDKEANISDNDEDDVSDDDEDSDDDKPAPVTKPSRPFVKIPERPALTQQVIDSNNHGLSIGRS